MRLCIRWSGLKTLSSIWGVPSSRMLTPDPDRSRPASGVPMPRVTGICSGSAVVWPTPNPGRRSVRRCELLLPISGVLAGPAPPPRSGSTFLAVWRLLGSSRLDCRCSAYAMSRRCSACAADALHSSRPCSSGSSRNSLYLLVETLIA